jgi:hypothetical protein
MPARILLRDEQRQLERLVEAGPADLLHYRLGDHEVAARKRSPKDRPQMPFLDRWTRSFSCATSQQVRQSRAWKGFLRHPKL